VLCFYVEDELGSLVTPLLLIMMVVKFAVVAMWFMHLRFDSKLFTSFFVSGIVLAVGVYVAALSTFHFFE
jgi:cytochrome c oxidase subunit IV